MYKMTVDFPNLAKGAEVQIDGLGSFENGFEHLIDDDAAQAYRLHHSQLVEEYDEEGVVVSRTLEQGPTLAQAFSGQKGITVKSAKTPKKDEPPEGGAS